MRRFRDRTHRSIFAELIREATESKRTAAGLKGAGSISCALRATLQIWVDAAVMALGGVRVILVQLTELLVGYRSIHRC